MNGVPDVYPHRKRMELMSELHDNVIEFFSEEKTATLSLHKKKYVNKVKKYAESRPDAVAIVENTDGTICATVPLSWIKISPPRQMTDEQREAARLRFSKSPTLQGEI